MLHQHHPSMPAFPFLGDHARLQPGLPHISRGVPPGKRAFCLGNTRKRRRWWQRRRLSGPRQGASPDGAVSDEHPLSQMRSVRVIDLAGTIEALIHTVAMTRTRWKS